MLQKITALRAQKKSQQRVSVFLDGKYAFGLQAFLAMPLRVGQTLSPEEIDELQRRDAIEVAYNQALSFLSYRPRSCAEVETYLERKTTPPTIAQAVIDRLIGAGLLDDEAFARYWVENREHFRPRGTRALRLELHRKGVVNAVIDKAMTDIDEMESAYRAASKRARRYAHLDYQVFRRRIGGFLQRRGFGYEVVKEIVDRLWCETQVSMEEEPG